MQVWFLQLLTTLLVAVLPFAASAQMRTDRTLSVQALPVQTTPSPPTAVTTPAPQARQSPVPVRRGPSGAYTSDAMGPSILAKNVDYDTTFKIVGVVPQGATISNVSWRYGLSAKPAGFDAVLCLNPRLRCWNVADSSNGSTTAFNGQDATLGFTLHYRVKGHGQIGPPARGEMNQLIVTYDLPH